ncbi:TonB-dependent receptor domain-containing protein [Flavobacterium sp.]|uniref:TonB-dependent receptor domain-containing protein n=1 Tax=Flavobacterium sp. TaxID=239 RepID=UPI003BBB7063
MKSIKFYLILSLLLASLLNYSQKKPEGVKIKITGKVIEKGTTIPLEYATISLINTTTNKVTSGGITNANGDFSFDSAPGTYTIKLEFISFKTIEIKEKTLTTATNLGTISLQADATQLKDVIITKEKTTVEIKLDKKIYNVGQDITIKGGSASDVLNNVPSVTVDGEGNVSLRGNDNVRILIDGMPSNANNIADALKSISADALDKVEVITNPSARYDAEGGAGIINIILKKGKNNGLNGTFTATVGDPKNYNTSGTINFRSQNFNIFSTIGYNDSKAPGNSLTDSDYINSEGTVYKTINEKVDRISGRKGYNYSFGVDWFLDKTLTWTNGFSYRKNDGANPVNDVINNYEVNNNFISNRYNDQFSHSYGVEYTTNFTKKFKKDGHKLTFDGTVSRNLDHDIATITNSYIGAISTTLIEASNNYQIQNRTLVQIDYVLPIGKNSQYEAGYRGNFNELDNNFKVGSLDLTGNYTPYTSFTNVFDYKEKINAIYTQFGSKISKFSYLLGIRYEDSFIESKLLLSDFYKYKKYDNFFPSAFLTYQIAEQSTISINYSKRIERPRNRFIIPFPNNYASNINLFIGNPDLNPSFTDALDFGYMNKYKKMTITTSLYYNKTKNPYQFVKRPNGDIVSTIVNGLPVDTPVYLTTAINLDKDTRYGLELNINYTPFKWWKLNGNFNFFKSTIVGNFQYTLNGSADVISQEVNRESSSWFTRVASKVTLPYKIDWQTNATYNAPQITFQGKTLGVLAANIAFSKDILKDKATVSLNVNDIFNSRKRIMQSNLPNLSSYGEMQYRQRQINLSFTYRFNKQKSDREKTKRDGEGESGDYGG